MPMISIIVPVYNVELYLEACLNSILGQSFSDFEVILVDDGSSDHSGAICDEYKNKDSRVIVIHQDNQGLSGARNTGLKVARGDYITFVDSDDVLAGNYLWILYDALIKENADISSCICHDFMDGTMHEFPESVYTGDTDCLVCDGKTALLELYKGNPLVLIGSPFKLYKRAVLKDLRFPVGRLHEDQAFTPLALYKAGKIVFVDSRAYYYRVRKQSITHQSFSIKRYDDVWAVDRCINYFRQKNEKEIVKAAKEKRQRLICGYSILARKSGIEVPRKYRVRLLPALLYLRKQVHPGKYEYYLAQVSPGLARLYEYERKIKSLLGKRILRINRKGGKK